MVSHEHASCSCTRTVGPSLLGCFGDTCFEFFPPLKLNTNPFLQSLPSLSVLSEMSATWRSMWSLCSHAVSHGAMVPCLAHHVASNLVLLFDGRLLCELRMADVITRATVDKQCAWWPSRGCHRRKTPTRRIDLHFLIFSIAPGHRLDNFFLRFLNYSHCTSFVLLSQSLSAFCTLVTPLRTVKNMRGTAACCPAFRLLSRSLPLPPSPFMLLFLSLPLPLPLECIGATPLIQGD